MVDLPEARHGTHIFGYLGVPEEERVSPDGMNHPAAGVREILPGNLELSPEQRKG